MKKRVRKLLALFMGIMIVTFAFPASIFAAPEDGAGIPEFKRSPLTNCLGLQQFVESFLYAAPHQLFELPLDNFLI